MNAWDKIDGYINWCVEWLTLCSKKLKPNGVLYFWHNDMEQIAELLMKIRKRTPLVFVSFCIWDKGDTYRAKTWHRRDPNGRTALCSWFNTCECCLHSFNAPIKLPGTEQPRGVISIKIISPRQSQARASAKFRQRSRLPLLLCQSRRNSRFRSGSVLTWAR